MLGKTPDEIGEFRKRNIEGYNFLVTYIVHQAKEQERQRRRAKSRRK